MVDHEINQLLHRGPDKLELIRQDIEIATILARISSKLITLKLTFEWTQMKTIDKLSIRILQEDIKFPLKSFFKTFSLLYFDGITSQYRTC